MTTDVVYASGSGPHGIARFERPAARRRQSAPASVPATPQALQPGEKAEACLTCTTLLRVPDAVRTFRCSACTTVNERWASPGASGKPLPAPLQCGEVYSWESGAQHHRNWPAIVAPDATLGFRTHEVFSSLACLERSFTVHSTPDEALDIDAAQRFFVQVERDAYAQATLVQDIRALLLRPGPELRAPAPDASLWRWAAVLLSCPRLLYRNRSIGSEDRRELFSHLLGLVAALAPAQQHRLVRFWARHVAACLPRLLPSVHSLIAHRLHACKASNAKIKTYASDWRLIAAVKVLSLAFVANGRALERAADDALSADAFYATAIEALGTSVVVQDFELFKRLPKLASDGGVAPFAFCQYPFVLSMGCKLAILSYESRRAMASSARSALRSTLAGLVEAPVLSIKVRRHHVVRDSLQQLFANRAHLKKPLRITFVGEEGIDAGGLLKEWLMLLSGQLFSPKKYDLFVHDDDSKLCWFNELSVESDAEFFLVGLVLGIAVYSSSPIDIPLPLAAFKMLMRGTPTFSDLEIFKPALARGLQQLLDFDGDVEETFCQVFAVDREAYGRHKQFELKPGGTVIPVTAHNRREYVDLLTQHTFGAARKQFDAFAAGFHQVVGSNAVSLHSAQELELLVRGQEPSALDIGTLKECSTVDGWPAGKADATVKLFWEYLAALSPREQRKVLAFICGSGRLPATGVLKLRLTCGGSPGKRLPTSHTCFNQICIPRYTSLVDIGKAMKTAIEGSEGFGLR